MARPSPRPFRILSRRFLTVLALALTTGPRATFRAIRFLVRGQRVRAWNLLCTTAGRSSLYYRCWISVVEPTLFSLSATKLQPRVSEVACMIIGTTEHDSEAAAARTRTSLEKALGTDASIIHVAADEAAALASAIHTTSATWIFPIIAGDIVSERLRATLSQALQSDQTSQILYWDEDRQGQSGREAPWIKPDWDHLLHDSCDLLSGAAIVRRDAAVSAIASREHITLTALFHQLLVQEGAPAPRHLSLILTHRRPDLVFNPRGSDVPRPPIWPTVSILIPTRDHVDLLRACMNGLAQLDYPGAVETIIIDNGSTDAETLAFLAELEKTGRARVIPMPGPFNFARINNHAAYQASGEMICLMNNDVVPVDGQWLSEMVRVACLPEAGATGALLLYPDGTIQHAGVAIGIGGAAGHVQKGIDANDGKDLPWSHVLREVSAVTAACMVVSRNKYLAAGGLDEAAFAVDFNDVDFCLRLKRSGLRNMFVPSARLFHHESKSRGLVRRGEDKLRFEAELENLQRRWNTKGYADPHYSPLFLRTVERCLLGF